MRGYFQKKKPKNKRTYTRSGYATKHATRYAPFDPEDNSPVARGGSSIFDQVPVLRIQGGAKWGVFLRRTYKTKPAVVRLATDRIFKRCCSAGNRCSKKSHMENCAVCFATKHIRVPKQWALVIREVSDMEHLKIVDPNGTHLHGHRAQSSKGLDFDSAQGFKLTSTQGRYKGTKQKWY